MLEDAARDLDVRRLLAAADVVRLAGASLPQRQLDPGAVVLDEEPVAHLRAVAVERQRLAVERVREEERQQLLRVLVRPVGVRAARDQRVDAVRPHRAEHLQVAARPSPREYGLDGRSGSSSRDDTPSGRRRRPRPSRRGGAGSSVARVVEQHLRARDVRLDELGRAEDRAVDVRLGGEVDDRVAAGGGLRDGLRVADVADDELGADVPSRFAGLPE